MDNPCLTIQYVIDNVTVSDDIIKIDGSFVNFTVLSEVQISRCMNITFTSYNGVPWVYSEREAHSSVKYGTFVAIHALFKKTKCKLLFIDINFRDTSLVESGKWHNSKYSFKSSGLLSTTLTVRNCLFNFSKYSDVPHWPYSHLIIIRSEHLIVNIENCTVKANYQIGILYYPGINDCPDVLLKQITIKNTMIEDTLYSVYEKLFPCTEGRRFELRIINSILRSNGKHHSKEPQFMVVQGQLNVSNIVLSVFMENSRFENLSVAANTAAVINVQGASKILIRNCVFTGNVGSRGGALSVQSKVLKIVGSQFYDNQARVITLCAHRDQGGCGGAIFIENSGGNRMEIYNCSFSNNMADCLGSSVYLGLFTTVVVRNTQFSTSFIGSPSTAWFSYSDNLYIDQVSFEAKKGSSIDEELFFARATNFTFGEQSPYFKCPLGSAPNISSSKVTASGIRSSKHVTCIYCPKGEYTLGPSNISGLSDMNGIKNRLQPQCQSCSFGAVCKRGIKPKPNFWGYEHKSRAFMTVCPPDYCCQTSDQCIALSSCNSKRTGRLCGKCKDGYFQSVFTNDCLENELCNTIKFWALAIVIFFLFSILFIFLQDVFLIIVKLLKVNKLVSDFKGRVDWLREKLWLTKNNSYHLKISINSEKIDQDYISNDSVDHREEEKDRNDEANLSNMENESSNNSTAGGLIKIVFFFYQIHSILTVYNSIREIRYLDEIRALVLSIFNLNAQVPLKSEFHCPLHGMGSITKVWIRTLFPVNCLLFAGFIYVCVYALSHFFSRSECIQKYSMKVKPRLLTAMLQLTLLGYSTLTSSILSLVTCISLVNGDRVLYIDGNELCYQPWQYGILIFIVFWAMPLIYALHKLPSYMKNGTISIRGVYTALLLPLPFAVYSVVRSTRKLKRTKVYDKDKCFANLTPYVRIQQPSVLMSQLVNVIEGPFRYKASGVKGEKLSWEPILLLQRILLSLCHTFVLEPGMRSLILLFLIIVFSNMNFHYRPFGSGFLSAANGFSFILLCITGIINAIYAFMYEYGSVPKGPLVQLLGIFDYLEVMVIMIFPSIAVGALCMLAFARFAAYVGSVAEFISMKFKHWKSNYD